jgi:hypothetical protein
MLEEQILLSVKLDIIREEIPLKLQALSMVVVEMFSKNYELMISEQV